MTPSQFCVWLNGYSAAKPEALDDNIRSKLDEIVAQLVADKLRSEREHSEMEMRKREYDLQMAIQQAKWPAQGYSKPVIDKVMYSSGTGNAQGVAVKA